MIITCKRCRQSGEKLCARLKCALERRPNSPGQHGKKPGMRKPSEYGRQLREKQKVKFIYGMTERQLRTFFARASKLKGVRGENLLITLERRLDNVLFRLKMASSRGQSRQAVVHGHVLVNGVKVKSPSFLVSVGDKISFTERSLKKETFVEHVVDKRMNRGIKVPEWLELQKATKEGVILRDPVRADIIAPIEEHLIVELYSK